jgi:TRAP-type C4-dicarboxylate transport system permease large subunit
MALALAATVIASVLYQGMVVQAVRDIQDDVRDMSIRELFRAVSKALGPLLWTVIIVVIGVFLGVLAFIIPGLVVLTRWAVAVPVVVVEDRTPFQAVGRSSQLVHGHGWQVFSVLIVTLLIQLVLAGVFGAIADGVIDSPVAYAVATLIGNTVTAPILALAVAVLYLALTRTPIERETPPPAQDTL